MESEVIWGRTWHSHSAGEKQRPCLAGAQGQAEKTEDRQVKQGWAESCRAGKVARWLPWVAGRAPQRRRPGAGPRAERGEPGRGSGGAKVPRCRVRWMLGAGDTLHSCRLEDPETWVSREACVRFFLSIRSWAPEATWM